MDHKPLKTRAESLFDQIIGRPKSPKNYLKDRTNINQNGANFSTYSQVSSRPLTDFRVESILKESESESFEKVMEKPKRPTKSRRNAKQDDLEKVEKKKKTGKTQTREKFSSPPPPSSSSAPKTRSKRSKAIPLTSTPTSHECEDKSRAFNRGPRIPFTTQQIQALEEKFKETSYLSSQEVWKLSKQLSIPENRVKIWFQNRRARRKRETSNSIDLSETKEPSSIKPVLETSDDELSH
ncbi:uncharacterized protein LOC141858657 isoform X2 [Brevipalpus obovatus]|uniref:uncharacterized protein LOC141858657 isoform X2 n=1 Tax=Brevipalpus obovatus TaxID=246614 RepID=UPI003D9F26ED